MNADGSGQRVLTRNAGNPGHPRGPVWSPDGRKIAFIGGGLHTTSGIFVMNADGTGLRRLTRNPGKDISPAWSPEPKK